jgi:hypothetical protein
MMRASTFCPDGETLRPLLGAVARQFVALDEGRKIGADEFHVDAAFLHVHHFAGDNRAFLDLTSARRSGFAAAALRRRRGNFAAGKLLDAERDALLLDVDVEHLGVDLIALLVFLNDLLARPLPVQVGQVHHAVDVAVETEEKTKLGLVLDLAFDQSNPPDISPGTLPTDCAWSA